VGEIGTSASWTNITDPVTALNLLMETRFLPPINGVGFLWFPYLPFDDLLLIDIRMPKMNGFQLYRQLRKVDEKAKICFITAFEIYYDEFKKMFPKLRVNCFVRKPVRLEELAKTIKDELELTELGQGQP
jgi:CheY-like chemotaxis protein